MKVEDLMKRDVKTVRTSDRLDAAVRAMRDHECGCVIVVDEPGWPVGMITDRDVSLTALETELPLSEIGTSQAMSRPIFTTRPRAELPAALGVMQEHQVRRLPVLDDAGRLVGVISLDDIALAAGRARGLFAHNAQAKEVGLALAAICRPHLIGPTPL